MYCYRLSSRRRSAAAVDDDVGDKRVAETVVVMVPELADDDHLGVALARTLHRVHGRSVAGFGDVELAGDELGVLRAELWPWLWLLASRRMNGQDQKLRLVSLYLRKVEFFENRAFYVRLVSIQFLWFDRAAVLFIYVQKTNKLVCVFCGMV